MRFASPAEVVGRLEASQWRFNSRQRKRGESVAWDLERTIRFGAVLGLGRLGRVFGGLRGVLGPLTLKFR